VPLPLTDSIARTCRAAQVDGGRPTPAAFELRYTEAGHEAYVSVNWLEFLHQGAADYQTKLQVLREWLLARPKGEVIAPSRNGALAVLPVQAVQGMPLAEANGSLDCAHEPRHEGDPHSGIRPQPGVETWPRQEDAPGRLAVQQFLFQAVCHYEAGR